MVHHVKDTVSTWKFYVIFIGKLLKNCEACVWWFISHLSRLECRNICWCEKKWLVCPNFIENDKLKVIRGKFRYKFLEILETFNNFREINFRVSIKIQLWHIMRKSLIPCINDIFSVYEHRKSVIYAQNHRYVCFMQEICDEKTNLMKFRWMSSSVSYYHKWYLVIRNVNIKIMTNNDKM